MNTKLSHIDERRLQLLSIQQQIFFILGWDLEAYAWYQYEQGQAYLTYQTGDDRGAYRFMEASPIFWGWWKNQWALRDEDFLVEANTTGRAAELHKMYFGLHNACVLFHGKAIHGHALDLSYASMIRTLNRSITAKRST